MHFFRNFNQNTEPASDFSKYITFYKTLDLNIIDLALSDYEHFECTDGESTFSIHSAEIQPKNNGIPVYLKLDEFDDKIKDIKYQCSNFNTPSFNKDGRAEMPTKKVRMEIKLY